MAVAMQQVVRAREGLISLVDGRVLGYAEYGPADGWPILYFHGTPGSRKERHPNMALALSAGARVVVVERPGYGVSSPKPGRKLIEWPRDVSAVADALGIDSFAVLGVSGGGPHALACAHALRERVFAGAVVSSLAPVDRPGGMAGLSSLVRLGLWMGRHAPWLVQPSLWLVGNPRRRPQEFALRGWAKLGKADQEVLRRPEVVALMVENFREAARHGLRGYADDVCIFGRPWGFELGAIHCPIYIWHGDDDRIAPPHMGRYLASAIANCHAHFIPGAGHFLAVDWLPEVLESLRQHVA
jgi:pimeloyl-ACP methyl ester carboxylesterase